MTREDRETKELRDYYNKKQALAKLEAELKELRERIDQWTGKEDTTRGLYTILYKDQTRTKTDTEGLYALYGITEEDVEQFRTRTKTRELKAILKG